MIPQKAIPLKKLLPLNEDCFWAAALTGVVGVGSAVVVVDTVEIGVVEVEGDGVLVDVVEDEGVEEVVEEE